MSINEKISELHAQLKEVQDANQIEEMNEDLVTSETLTHLATTQVLVELKLARAVAEEVFGENYRPVDIWSVFDTINKTKLQAVFMAVSKHKAKGGAQTTLDNLIKQFTTSGGGGLSGPN